MTEIMAISISFAVGIVFTIGAEIIGFAVWASRHGSMEVHYEDEGYNDD